MTVEQDIRDKIEQKAGGLDTAQPAHVPTETPVARGEETSWNDEIAATAPFCQVDENGRVISDFLPANSVSDGGSNFWAAYENELRPLPLSFGTYAVPQWTVLFFTRELVWSNREHRMIETNVRHFRRIPRRKVA